MSGPLIVPCPMCGVPTWGDGGGNTYSSNGRTVCSERCAVDLARAAAAIDDYGASKARVTVRRGDYPGPGRALWAIRMLQAQGWRIVEETTDGGVMWQDPNPARSGRVQAKTILEFETMREFEGLDR